MPHKDAVTSDSESERQHTGSAHKKYSAKKARRSSSDVADMSDVEEMKSAEDPSEGAAQGDEGEEEGEEYEIELILDAKKGQFSGGRMGYFVKWKNYGAEHNSWVDEDDAANAQELIDEFWNKRRKNKAAARKSEPIKSRPKSVTAKPSRKSLAQESSPEVVEAPASTKKRGRPRKSGVDSDVEVQAGSDEPRVKKKSRKSDGANRKADKPDSEDEVGNMNIHLHVPSWEHLIESVDTVERDSDGELIVYFTLKNGKGRKRENSRLCAERFPQKLIKFYESNLRWRVEEAEADN